MSARAAAAALGLLLAACSSSGTSVAGTIGPVEYDLGSALLLNSTAAGSASSTTLILSNDADLCAQGTSSSVLHDVELDSIGLAILAPSGVLVAPNTAGSFAIVPGPLAAGSKLASSEAMAVGSCAAAAPTAAMGGAVELTEIELDDAGLPARLVGSVSLEFNDGGTLAGTFDATACTGTFSPAIAACP